MKPHHNNFLNAGILPRIRPFTANAIAKRIQVIATLIFVALPSFGGPQIADVAGASVQRLPAVATIRFAGTSTLHDFGGTLPSQPFTLVLSNRTWSAQADVLASLMNTANKKRDHKMHQMFATNSFPKMHGTITAVPISGTAGTNATLRLKIRNKSHDLPVRITGWTEDARQIKFHATWELSLDDYALKPPSVAGVIRVGDRVKLEADVTASKTNFTTIPSTRKP